MRFLRTALASAALLVLLGSSAAAFASTGSGYVTYGVHFSSGAGMSKDFTVNVTSAPSSNPKLDNVLLQIVGSSLNLSYSKAINATTQVFPMIPAISNQSFSYSANSTSVSLKVAQNGSSTTQFQGRSYTLTSYSLTAAVSYGNYSATVLGALDTFPSGLVYSLKGSTAAGSYSFALTLKATSLALDSASATPASQVASIGLGAGAVVAALSLSLGIRSRRKHKAQEETRPEYWVD